MLTIDNNQRGSRRIQLKVSAKVIVEEGFAKI